MSGSIDIIIVPPSGLPNTNSGWTIRVNDGVFAPPNEHEQVIGPGYATEADAEDAARELAKHIRILKRDKHTPDQNYTDAEIWRSWRCEL